MIQRLHTIPRRQDRRAAESVQRSAFMPVLILAFFSLLLLYPLGNICAFAAPQVKLEAPATVARGDAFVALAVSEEPVTAFNFKWMGKSYAATAVAAAQAPGGPQKWQAVMLLPVPLDAKENEFTLSVTPIAGHVGSKKPAAD